MHKTGLRLLCAAILMLPLGAAADDRPQPLPPPPFEFVTGFGSSEGPPLPQSAGAPFAGFAPGEVLTAARLNAALAAPQIIGGSINGVPIGQTNRQPGAFTTLSASSEISQPAGNAIFRGGGFFQVGDGNVPKRVLVTSQIAPLAGVMGGHFLVQGNAFGTVTGGSGVAAYRAFNVTADSLNAAGAPGGGAIANYFGHTISAGAVGGRTTLHALLDHTGASTSVAGTFYVALGAFAQSSASAGGTAGLGNTRGSMFGANFSGLLKPGAGLFWRGVTALELNVGLSAGTSATAKVGMQIVQWSVDAVQGTVTDAALVVSAQSQAQVIGWRQGISFGVNHGSWPMHPDGTLIGTGEQNGSLPQRYQMTTAHGIDFATVPVLFTGRAFHTPGFAIDGTGQATIGSNTIGWNAAGLSIGAQGRTATLSSIAAGGSGTYLVGDILRDPHGGVWVVSSVNGSNQVTGLTMHKAPTITSGAAPSNPVALAGTGGRAGGASINLTWTDASEIIIAAGRMRSSIGTVAGIGSTQGAAAPVPATDLVLVTATSGQRAVILPLAQPGRRVQLKADDANTDTVQIFPAVGDRIQANGVNVSIQLFTTTVVELVAFEAGKWTIASAFPP